MRSHTICIRFSEEEDNAVKQRAKDAGFGSVSEYARMQLLNGKPINRMSLDESLTLLMEEFRKWLISQK